MHQHKAEDGRRTDDTVRALEAWDRLVRATETLRSQLQRSLAFRRLTVSQFSVLEAIAEAGPLCQRDIARRLLLSGGNITTVVDNLQKRGLVLRVRSTTDRRFITVHLTDEGRKLVEAISPHHARLVRDLMEALAPDEMQRLAELCHKLEVEAA